MPKALKFFHSGDIGDIIYALPVMREMGGGVLYLGDRGYTRPITYFESVKKLILAGCDYITDVLYDPSNRKDWIDMSKFRPLRKLATLVTHQAEAINVHSVDTTTPWINLKVDKHDKYVVGRSARYHNNKFPWSKIIERHADNIIYVGFHVEHSEFEKQFNVKVDFKETKDLLEVAKIIAGGKRYIGNQSSPYAIAEGLKVPTLQETCDWTPDCVFPRAEAAYCHDGNVPEYDGFEAVEHPKKRPRLLDRNRGIQGGHRFTHDGHNFIAPHFNALRKSVRRIFPDITDAQLDEFNARRAPAELRIPEEVPTPESLFAMNGYKRPSPL